MALQQGWPGGGSTSRMAALQPLWVCNLAASLDKAFVDPVRIVERRLSDACSKIPLRDSREANRG